MHLFGKVVLGGLISIAVLGFAGSQWMASQSTTTSPTPRGLTFTAAVDECGGHPNRKTVTEDTGDGTVVAFDVYECANGRRLEGIALS